MLASLCGTWRRGLDVHGQTDRSWFCGLCLQVGDKNDFLDAFFRLDTRFSQPRTLRPPKFRPAARRAECVKLDRPASRMITRRCTPHRLLVAAAGTTPPPCRIWRSARRRSKLGCKVQPPSRAEFPTCTCNMYGQGFLDWQGRTPDFRRGGHFSDRFGHQIFAALDAVWAKKFRPDGRKSFLSPTCNHDSVL